MGPSNIGLTDPAHMTAISLMHATVAQLGHIQSVDQITIVKVLMILDREIGDAFLAVESKIMEEEEVLSAVDGPVRT